MLTEKLYSFYRAVPVKGNKFDWILVNVPLLTEKLLSFYHAEQVKGTKFDWNLLNVPLC